MSIDNFDTWFETLKVQLKRKEESVNVGSASYKADYVIETLRDKFEECWNNAFEAGKESNQEEVKKIQEEISYLQANNNELEMRLDRAEAELEDASGD